MDKQLPSVISVGELWLFMIGIVASVALLVILMIPFFSRMLIPTHLRVSGATLTPDLLRALKLRFKRDGYEMIAEELTEEGALRLLQLRSDSVTYSLTPSAHAEEEWTCLLSSDALDLAQDEPLSILTSAGPGWFVLRLERHLKACAPDVTLSWSRGQGSEGRARPLSPMARYAVTIAPWR